MNLFRLFLKLVIVLVIGVALLIAGGLWWLNRYIHTPEFAARISQQLTQSTGVPITLRKVRLSFREGLSVEGIEVKNPNSASPEPLVAVAHVAVNLSWPALADHQISITELIIQKPSVVLAPNSEGKFILPSTTPQQTSTPSEEKSPTTSAASSQPVDFSFSLKGFHLNDGSFVLKQADGTALLVLQGIDTTANTRDEKSSGINGVLKIDDIRYLSKLNITSLQSPFSVQSGVLSLSSLQAALAQGQIKGTLDETFSSPDLPYNLKLDLQNCDVNDLLTTLANKPQIMSGKLDAKTSWLGPANAPLAVSGKGFIEIRNGQIINLPLFRQLSKVFSLAQLAQPDFSELKSDFSVGNQAVTISDFLLKSSLFDVTGAGTVGFDSTLNLQVKLALSPEVTRQLPQAIENNFTKRDDGFFEISFTVTGTIDQPQTDLLQKMLLGNKPLNEETISEGIDALKSLFGKKKKKAGASTNAPAMPPPTNAPAATPETNTPTTTPPPATPETNAPVQTPPTDSTPSPAPDSSTNAPTVVPPANP